MSGARRTLGRRGEDMAVRYLCRSGWRILDRNWRSGVGEIDVVACRGRELVVVEVRTRSSARFGTAVESITDDKVRRLRRLAGAYVRQCETPFDHVRIDVIGLDLQATCATRLTHVQGVG